MARLHVLRVFTGEDGEWGNPLGVFLDGAEVAEERRQAVASELGFSETVFVDDADDGRYRIFTPATELPFAGHPTVGTAWLLEREGHGVDVLRAPAGEIAVRRQDELIYAAARGEWCPDFEFIRLEGPRQVDEMQGAPVDKGMAYCWAWEDEAAGVVRSRCFPVEEGIEEDEATGSAAIALCVALDRPLRIHQGRGSLLHTTSLGEGRAEVGGLVVLDEVREHPVAKP